MVELQQFCEKDAHQITDYDVLDFLISKDVDGSGRTVVHAKDCDNLGDDAQNTSCFDNVRCGMRHGKSSLRTGYMVKLKTGFRELGYMTKWNPRLKSGNPADSHLVKKYQKFVQREQGIAGIIPKQVPPFEFSKLRKLMMLMSMKQGSTDSKFTILKIKRDMSIYAFLLLLQRDLMMLDYCYPER